MPRRFHHFLVPAIATLLASGAAGCSRGGRTEAKGDAAAILSIEVAPVAQESLRRPIELVGTLAAADEVTIASEVGGKVVRILADLGDHVSAGQVVVELDREKLQYKLDEQRAALNSALARYGVGQPDAELPSIERTPDVQGAAAQRNVSELAWKRAAKLTQSNLLSQEQYELAEAKYATDRAAYEVALQGARNLRADIDASRALAQLAARDLADASIRAPFDGYIQKRYVSPGQFIPVQAPVVGLVKVDPLKLIAEVPERMAPWVKPGTTVVLSIDAFPDRRIEGTVSRLSPAVNQQTRAFPLEASVPNPAGALKPGSFARAHLDSDRVERILTVPYSAIQSRFGVNRLFVVKDGQLTSVEVKLGDRFGDRVEIVDGITAGVLVAASDVDRLADGMKVKAKAKTST